MTTAVAIGIRALTVVFVVAGIATIGAAIPAEMVIVTEMLGSRLIGAGIGIGVTEIQDLSDNGKIDSGTNAYVGAGVGGFVAGAVLPYAAGAETLVGSIEYSFE